MERTLQDDVKKELCLDGLWQLTDTAKLMLKRQISRLPKSKVTENETRYPTTAASIRAFLEVFFTRHYFQVQNSLLDYMTSNEFLNLLESGRLQILDIGCGPAVASLAITDMLSCVLRKLQESGKWPRNKTVKTDYVLNDTSGICLGTGQHMLADYFRLNCGYDNRVVCDHVIRIQKAFPDNISQLHRIRFNLGVYDIAIFCYVVKPLTEDESLKGFVGELFSIEEMCNHRGRILILQDKFQESLIRRIGKNIECSSNKQTLCQEVYPKRNENETHTYTYYRCLYAPRAASVKDAAA